METVFTSYENNPNVNSLGLITQNVNNTSSLTPFTTLMYAQPDTSNKRLTIPATNGQDITIGNIGSSFIFTDQSSVHTSTMIASNDSANKQVIIPATGGANYTLPQASSTGAFSSPVGFNIVGVNLVSFNNNGFS